MEASTNSDLALLATSGIRRFSALAAKVDGCVRLTLGEPEFPTPPPVCEAVARSLAKGQTHYPPNNGRPELLEALSAYMRRHGLGYGPEELVVTCGATEALSATLMAILDPGDEVVVPTPAFGLYETIVRAAHGRVATLDTSCSGFQIRERDLRGVVGPKTRAIVITSPNNPTGCVLDSESLDAVADVAAERGLVVVCDDVYNRLCYEEGYERFAPRHPELRDQTVVVDSFSKPWAMTGWRLGWLAAAPAWNIVGCEMGYGNIGEHIYNTLGMNVVSRKNYFLKHIDPKFPHEEFTARTRVVFREIVDREGLAVKPGAKELIMLGKENGYRLAVATSSRIDYASRLLKEAKVYDYFDGFVFGDMVSHSKPDPEIYEKACEAIGVLPQQSVAFEDAPAGIRSAAAEGLRVVAVPDLVQPPKELEEMIWMKLDTLEEMVEYIKED